jgi:DNA-binding MarR family transcriptional regulator
MVNSYLEITLNALTYTMPCNDDPLTELPGYALRRAANAMMAELATRLAELDLRISEASVLQIIAGRTDLTSSDIGKILDIQRANMAPLLGRLEAAALIRREPIDRKSQAVVLTELGNARLSDVRRITAQFEDDLMARIPAPHREHFLPALQALTD